MVRDVRVGTWAKQAANPTAFSGEEPETGNFGWAILIVTFLVKVLFFPLANKS